MFVHTTKPMAANTHINAGDFWPTVYLVKAREGMRLDGTVTDERLRAALVEAIATVNDELADWHQIQVASGYKELADIPATAIDGVSVNVARWQRAVLCLATANLNERYRTFDSTAAGNKRADDWENTVDDLRRDAHWAINDIRRVLRTTIELI